MLSIDDTITVELCTFAFFLCPICCLCYDVDFSFSAAIMFIIGIVQNFHSECIGNKRYFSYQFYS